MHDAYFERPVRRPFFAAPPMHRGMRRMRRGDIRTALLAVLAEGPGHGYDMIKTLETKSDGAWRPSPGSVYPTLQLLEDEGLVRSVERDDKRVYEITEDGRAEAARRIEQAGGAPWESLGDGSSAGSLRRSIGQLVLAGEQLATVGTKEQVEQAIEILDNARKRVYQLLAE